MEFVAKPLFMDWHRYVHSDLSAQLMRNLLFNCKQWTDLLEQEVSQRAVHLRSDSVLSARPIASSAEDGRSSLQEMADLELQSPDILAKRRMSASGFYPLCPFRKFNVLAAVKIEQLRVWHL